MEIFFLEAPQILQDKNSSSEHLPYGLSTLNWDMKEYFNSTKELHTLSLSVTNIWASDFLYI